MKAFERYPKGTGDKKENHIIMKRKILTLILAICVAMSATGCGESKGTFKYQIDEDMAEDIESEETEEKETTIELEEETKKTKKTGAVLGGDEENFDEYEYLYDEILMTESEENEESGKMESKKVTILLPIDDYTSVNRDYAYSNKLGVNFRVSLNPRFQYKQEDYLLSENLQAFLDSEFDEYYSTDYKDLVISEVEELDDNRVRATANYVEYDKWDEVYKPVYNTYYVVELEKDLSVLVEVEVDLAEVTGKTQQLIEELETFYEFDIDWDQAVAEKKVEDFLANDTGDTDSFSTGYLMFDLPKNWDEDRDFGDYSVDAYAPDGDSAFAECVVVIAREFMSEEMDVTMLLKDEEYTKEYLTELIGESITNLTLEDAGDTAIGTTVKVSFDAEEEGSTFHYVYYFSGKDYYMYTIYAIQTEKATEDAIAVAEDIVANGKLKKY